MSLIALFVAVGTAVGLVRALPQLVRLLRTRDAHGVSVDTAGTSSVVSFAWVVYGALTTQGAVAAASGASAATFALVTLTALHLGRRARELRTTPIWLAALLVAGLAGGAGGLALLLPVSVLVANVPQLLVARRERDLSGLSPGTWLLTMLEATLWGSYGLFAGDRAILLHAILNLATSGGIVALRLAKSGRAARRVASGSAAA